MLAQIETAIVDLLSQSGLNVRDVDLNDTGDSAAVRKARSEAVQRTKLPAVFCAIEHGGFAKISEQLMQCQPRILVAVAFKEFANDRDRRQGAVQIVESIIALLALQTLGLDIDPLMPGRFYNITDEDLADRGISVYQIELSTAFDIERETAQATLDDLLAVYATWDIDDDQDGEPTPTDIIELEGGE